MKVFKSEKSRYRINEAYSWIGLLIFGVIFYFVSTGIFSALPQTTVIALSVLSLLKLSDLLIQYRAEEIILNPITNEISIVLHSILSGREEKNYTLRDIRSEIIVNKKLGFLLQYSTLLKIYLPNNKAFVINERYGFLNATLEEIDNHIRKIGLNNG